MSKARGNFYTLNEMIEKYGADASRITLSDAGDNLDDANFVENIANISIQKLT